MRRVTLVSAVLVVVADVALLAVALGMFFARPATTAPSPTRRGGASLPETVARHVARKDATSATTSPVERSTYHPLRVVPPQTAVQQTVDQSLVQQSAQGISVLNSSTWTAPALSRRFGPIDSADLSSATLYAMAFTQELLDINFATSTRRQLLAWADYNDAPYCLGHVPASLAARVLGVSLTTSSSPSSSPVPSATIWSKFAASRMSWSVSGLVVSVSPTWTQALSAGWEPVDPLMGIYDVSGSLRVTSPGHDAVVKSISFALTLGGALLHPGYGAVALDNWTVN
ncbi:MAG: hypothetical protein HIU57_05440 [Acidobacteria bacterium]|nr:hypothetical protein [Acidobacteriota bacterium]